jgi:hypothetical protein
VTSAVFGLSRIGYYAAGARFDDHDLARFWHFVSPELLKTRLLESVFYLHFQPPLFNLYLGVVLKLFGGAATLAFAISYAALGLGFAWALLWLMRAQGARLELALAFTALVIVSPAFLLFESYLFYTYPVVIWVTLAAASLHAAARTGHVRWWSAFFALLALIVLTRALFHPLWMLVIALGLLWLRRGDRRRIVLAAAVPLLLVGLVCAKNWVVFGEPGTSSWFGMGMARMSVRDLQPSLRARWIREGKLSPLAAVRPPGTLAQYERYMALPAPTGIPVLDQRQKPSGDINLHHLAYVEISRRLGRDAIYVIRRRPQLYFASVAGALRRFLSPAADWHPLERNRVAIAGYVSAYDSAVHFAGPLGRSGLMLYLLPLMSAWAALRSWIALRRDRHHVVGLVFGFMAFNIVYVSVTGCLLEPRENMRFRLLVEPFLWLLLATVASELVQTLVGHGSRWRESRTLSRRA